MPREQVTALWGDILDIWKSGQTQLPEVVRWSADVDDVAHGGARRQDSLAHSYSLTLLGLILLERLSPFVRLDKHLLATTFLVHDHGEGELNRDVLYDQKTEQADLDEYMAFKKRFELLGDTYPFFEKAFLVQFARNAPQSFPPEAQTTMKALVANNYNECLFFDAVERFDYVLFALEQYKDRGNESILMRVLNRQMPYLDALAKELAGFDTIWTHEVSTLCAAFTREHGTDAK